MNRQPMTAKPGSRTQGDWPLPRRAGLPVFPQGRRIETADSEERRV
jgi:hypothetical protein